MDGHYVTVRLHALCDECLLPRQVAYHSAAPARAQACRKHYNIVVTVEAGLNHCGEVAALVARLVYGYAERSQPRKVHQQVVDEIAQAAVVVAPDDCAEGNTVCSAQRVVAHESVQAAVVLGRKVLAPHYVERHVKITHARLQPLYARKLAVVPKKLVDLVLVEYAFEPLHDRRRNVTRPVAHLAPQYLPTSIVFSVIWSMSSMLTLRHGRRVPSAARSGKRLPLRNYLSCKLIHFSKIKPL